MSFPISAQLLDACVLGMLMKGDSYGYELTLGIQQAVDVSESTLYPVLRRLQKDGHLGTYDQPFQGRNRRYYTLTASGREQYYGYLREWSQFKHRVEKLLSGGLT